MSGLTKHLLNTPEDLVVDSLTGLATLNPNVSLDVKSRVLYRNDHNGSTVSIISGGGSGHEPAHAGFVGKGMLTAAVAGNIFASPNVSQIRRGIHLAHASHPNSAGVLVVVKNYTGDVLHFGLAAEQTRAAALSKEEASKVRVIVVGDDVAVGRTQGGLVGRRGLAGTILVYKIAGGLAQQGGSIDDVEAIAKLVAENVATYGVGLEHCHVPGTKVSDEHHLAVDELELGMGIHNEPGFTHLKPYPPLPKLVGQMLDSITSSLKEDPERGFLENLRHDGKDEVVLLVNNLGSVSQLEMGGIVKEAVSHLRGKNFVVRQVLSGTYMTSLNMPGFSLTLLLLPRSGAFPTTKILEYLDAQTDAPGWPWYARAEPASEAASVSVTGEADSKHGAEGLPVLKPIDSATFLAAMKRAAEALVAAEPEITRQDTIAGDGDAGLTLKSGAQGLLKAIDSGAIKGQNVIADVLAIAEVVEDTMGGTSGALYSIFFSGLAGGLRAQAEGGADTATLDVWAKALSEALAILYKYTRARPPSRTLVDPLNAFVTSFSGNPSFPAAVEAAKQGAEATRHQQATAGRSAYVDRAALEGQNVPDPGAWGVWVIVNALLG
ncbi:dihydroxyacetone kinase [Clavulina sp. PMI_390]|nr:dihydroxyacetone kinase [Clavulina sp. PMI_390]